MRRFLVPALVSVFPWLAALTPASGAVHQHTYQITGGTSSGVLNIGAITGGTFKFQVNNPSYLLCGPNAATCPGRAS